MLGKVKRRRCEVGNEEVILCTRALHEAGLEYSGSFNIVTSSLRVKVVRRAQRHYTVKSGDYRSLQGGVGSFSGGLGLGLQLAE